MNLNHKLRALVPVLLGLAMLTGLLAGCGAGGGRTVTVQLADAAGLFEGNDVGVLGVPTGTVLSVTPAGERVDVVLRLDDDVQVPADAAAVVVSRSVATDRYVELTPRYTSGPQLQDGDTIPVERTRTPVEFDQMLSTLTDVSEGLGGEDGEAGALNRLLTSSAENLSGNGVKIRDGLGDLADVMQDVEGGLGDAEGAVRELDELTGDLAENGDLVREFTGQVADATQMLDEQKQALTSTFRALAAMVAEVAAFVRDHRDDLDGQLEDFTSLATDLNAHREDYERLLDTAPLMLQNFTRAIDEDDRLAFRTRPLSLVPGKTAVSQLCHEAPAELCERLGLLDLPLFDVLRHLAGVRDQ
ncbi:MCE family protein [Aeromicrobium sp. CTD01-1L150]|uniref:MCE family protein n=1 Tax=Aeromicrobium sp. CTD01-1L150 TaxID=3341830 RepID=UPI0035BF80F1